MPYHSHKGLDFWEPKIHIKIPDSIKQHQGKKLEKCVYKTIYKIEGFIKCTHIVWRSMNIFDVKLNNYYKIEMIYFFFFYLFCQYSPT